MKTLNKKNSRRKFIGSGLLIGSMLAGSLVFGSMAYAGPHCGGFGGKHGGHGKFSQRFDNPEFMQKRLDRMSVKLGLSDTQKDQIKTLMETHTNTVKPLRNEKKAIRDEMKNLDPTSTDYAKKLADIANRKAELVRQLTVARGSKRQQMAQILTPEQRAKKQEMRENRMNKYRRGQY